MHYNSVRSMEDPCLRGSPALPIGSLGNGDGSDVGGSGSEAERLVKSSVPSAVSMEQVRATLADVEGDAESAIQLLIGGYLPEASAEIDPNAAAGLQGAPARSQSAADDGGGSGAVTTPKATGRRGKPNRLGAEQHSEKRAVTRQELCPCGSKRK